MTAYLSLMAAALSLAACPAASVQRAPEPRTPSPLAGSGIVEAHDFTTVTAALAVVEGREVIRFAIDEREVDAFPLLPPGPCTELPGGGWGWVVEGAKSPMVIVLDVRARVFSKADGCWHEHASSEPVAGPQIAAEGQVWELVKGGLEALDPSLAGYQVELGTALVIVHGESRLDLPLGPDELDARKPDDDSIESHRRLVVQRLQDEAGALRGLRITTDEQGRDASEEGGRERRAVVDVAWQDGAFVHVLSSIDTTYGRSGDGSYASIEAHYDISTRGELTGTSVRDVSDSGSDRGGVHWIGAVSTWEVAGVGLLPVSPGEARVLETKGPPVALAIDGCKLGLSREAFTVDCGGGNDPGSIELFYADEVGERAGSARAEVAVGPRTLHVTVSANLDPVDPNDPFEDPPSVSVQAWVSRLTGQVIELGTSR